MKSALSTAVVNRGHVSSTVDAFISTSGRLSFAEESILDSKPRPLVHPCLTVHVLCTVQALG